MEHYWEMERYEDTPQFWDQQSGFLWPVEQPYDYHWMPEPSNTVFAQQNEMGRCLICDGNHPSDQCIFRSEWENFWRQSCYEEPSHFTDPYYPSYPPPNCYDLQQHEPSEEEQLFDMVKDLLNNERLDTMVEISRNQLESIQRQTESIQRMTDKIRQMNERQNNIPQEPFSDDIDEAFKYQSEEVDMLKDEEAGQYHQPEVSVPEPKPAKYSFDFYYSDSDEDEVEIFVPTKVEDGILYPQLEDLGSCIATLFEEELPTTEEKSRQTETTLQPLVDDFEDCFAQLFDEELPESPNPAISEDEDLMTDTSLHPQGDTHEARISQMTDEELDAEIFKCICENEVDQEAEQMEEIISEHSEDPGHSRETSLFWGVEIKDIAQKLDRMELPFQVKHHTRPPDFLSFFAGTTGATKFKEVAQEINGIKSLLLPYRWKRPFKSNAHGIVYDRTSKTTLKPP